MPVTHQLSLNFFFNEITSYFIYIFQSKSLAFIFLTDDYVFSDILIYYLFNKDLISKLILVLVLILYTYCKQYKKCFYNLVKIMICPWFLKFFWNVLKTPKLSKYLTLLSLRHNATQWFLINSYLLSRFTIYSPSFILGKLFLE